MQFTNILAVDANQEHIKQAIEIPEIDDLIFNHTVDINIIFIGFDGYGIDTDYWDQELLDWYLPFPSANSSIEFQLHSSSMPYPMYYNYDFQYIFANTTTTSDFFTYLDAIKFIQPDPVPPYLVDWRFSPGDYIYGVSATDIEYWLATQFSYLPGYSLVLINSLDYISYWYSYAFDFLEPDISTSQYLGYMNCFAGNNTLAFYDYSTPPSNGGTNYDFGLANNVTYVPTIYETWTGSEFDSVQINENLITVTQSACDFVFTPSYLYYPSPFDNYLFYYLLIDCTSDDYAWNNPFEFINSTIVMTSYDYLLPTVNWEYKFLKMKLSSDPELQKVVNLYYDDYGKYGILRAEEGGINELVENYWISYENETTRVLPVIFFIFDKITWYNSMYTAATANGKDGKGWEVVGTLDKGRIFGGSTALSTHEAGHFLGLRHPHDGWSWKAFQEISIGEITYWLWDYQATTMTYAINYPYFNQMNKMQLYRGQNLEYLNHTYFTIVEAYTTLDTRGFTEIPSEFQDMLGNIYLEILSINSSFRIYDYVSALPYSKAAAYYSDQLLEIANTIVVIPEFAHISIFLTTTMIMVTLSLCISRKRK